ncbi:MAG: tRNA (adenosine(37)-N6)-dimethylallyltransferase MiaA [Coriobacteriia bacterium]|nr:tRNA (adenosine(37)-N6)-dimethylallyltransferase MiaA [Coriobacteriia bacterium]
MVRSPDVLAIVGPTAVGKSGIADGVARTLGAEIVSADSMQVYRGMDVGTAKTPPAQRSVPYHCIDLLDPGTPYSAALFQADARTAIDALRVRGVPSVLVGGTGLYVRAALDTMEFPSGETTSSIRFELERRATVEGPRALHDELTRLDPASAALVHPNNTRRVIRSLEMLAAGTSYAKQASGFSRRTFHYAETTLIGLTLERGELYHRIDERVDTMVDTGLLDEVQRLLERGFADALTSTQAIGYKELVPVLRGQADPSAAIDEIKRSTRRYAKRQLAWFRADPRVSWLDVTGLSTPEAIDSVLDLLESTGHSA